MPDATDLEVINSKQHRLTPQQINTLNLLLSPTHCLSFSLTRQCRPKHHHKVINFARSHWLPYGSYRTTNILYLGTLCWATSVATSNKAYTIIYYGFHHHGVK